MVAGGDLQEVRATLAQLTWLLTLMAGWGWSEDQIGIKQMMGGWHISPISWILMRMLVMSCPMLEISSWFGWCIISTPWVVGMGQKSQAQPAPIKPQSRSFYRWTRNPVWGRWIWTNPFWVDYSLLGVTWGKQIYKWWVFHIVLYVSRNVSLFLFSGGYRMEIHIALPVDGLYNL